MLLQNCFNLKHWGYSTLPKRLVGQEKPESAESQPSPPPKTEAKSDVPKDHEIPGPPPNRIPLDQKVGDENKAKEDQPQSNSSEKSPKEETGSIKEESTKDPTAPHQESEAKKTDTTPEVKSEVDKSTPEPNQTKEFIGPPEPKLQLSEEEKAALEPQILTSTAKAPDLDKAMEDISKLPLREQIGKIAEFAEEQVEKGNMEPIEWKEVKVGPITTADGRKVMATIQVSSHDLAIKGKNGEKIMIPGNGITAGKLANTLNIGLPTDKLVDAIEDQARQEGGIVPFTAAPTLATVKDPDTGKTLEVIDPQTGHHLKANWGEKYGTTHGKIMQSAAMMQASSKASFRGIDKAEGKITAGDGKNIIIHADKQSDLEVIYGGIDAVSEKRVQRVNGTSPDRTKNQHELSYADYSHRIRGVNRKTKLYEITAEGKEKFIGHMDYYDLLQHKEYSKLVTHKPFNANGQYNINTKKTGKRTVSSATNTPIVPATPQVSSAHNEVGTPAHEVNSAQNAPIAPTHQVSSAQKKNSVPTQEVTSNTKASPNPTTTEKADPATEPVNADSKDKPVPQVPTNESTTPSETITPVAPQTTSAPVIEQSSPPPSISSPTQPESKTHEGLSPAPQASNASAEKESVASPSTTSSQTASHPSAFPNVFASPSSTDSQTQRNSVSTIDTQTSSIEKKNDHAWTQQDLLERAAKRGFPQWLVEELKNNSFDYPKKKHVSLQKTLDFLDPANQLEEPTLLLGDSCTKNVDRQFRSKNITAIAEENQTSSWLLQQVEALVSSDKGKEQLAQTKHVFILIGVNELQGNQPENIIANIKKIYDLLHRANPHLNIVIATLPPFKGWPAFNQNYNTIEAKRQKLNTLIRNCNEWQKDNPPLCIDLAKFFDTGDGSLKKDFDSGDHLHPNKEVIAYIIGKTFQGIAEWNKIIKTITNGANGEKPPTEVQEEQAREKFTTQSEFKEHPEFPSEQFYNYNYGPENDPLSISINAPKPLDPNKETKIVVYTCPNGSTNAETEGYQANGKPNYQHFLAQIRALRANEPESQVVAVTMSAKGLSFPSWRQRHPNHSEIFKNALGDVQTKVTSPKARFSLLSHSGGGSISLELVRQYPEALQNVDTIAWLDAHYNYKVNTAESPTPLLVEWLKSNPKARLVISAYDDRTILGKKIPTKTATGETVMAEVKNYNYDRTLAIIDEFKVNGIPLTQSDHDGYQEWSNDQISIKILKNPTGAILHSEVTRRNGIYDVFKKGSYNKPLLYEEYIQKQPTPNN